MPAIPESTCSSITLRLLDHAAKNWPQVKNLHVKCSRGFAYVTAALPGQDEPQPLFRLRYGGSAHFFGFAYYSWAAGRYEDSLLITGSPVGTPQEALDTIATFYVSDTDDEPPTNLQTQPLRAGYQEHGSMRAVGHKLGRLVDLTVLQRLFPDNFLRYGGYGE